MLIDCGYVAHKTTRDNADKLRTMLGKKCIELHPHCGRVLVKVPPTKEKKILAAFPNITAEKTYQGATHYFGPDGEHFHKYTT